MYDTYFGATSSSVNLESENETNCKILSNVKSALNDPIYYQICFIWQIMFYDNNSISFISPCNVFYDIIARCHCK